MIATLDRPIVPINELIPMKVISDFLESDRFDSTSAKLLFDRSVINITNPIHVVQHGAIVEYPKHPDPPFP